MYEITKVRVGDIQVDEYTQRQFKPSHVDHLARGWNEDFAGVLTLNRRDNGVIYCVDGQHRFRAAQAVKGDSYEMTALLHHGMSRQQEADLFIAINSHRWPTPKLEEYRISLTAEKPLYLAVDAVLTACNLTMGRKAGHHVVGAVAACMRIASRSGGPANLRNTLTTCASAWGYFPETWDSDVMQAVALVFELNEVMDYDRLLATLQKHSPASWKNVMAPRARGGGGSSSRPSLVNSAIVQAYNKGLRSRKIVGIRKG